MNIFKRIILPVLIALSLIIVLVACHKDEITVYQAILKTNKIKSVETDTQVSFKFDYENSDEAIMEKLKTVMNNIKLSAKTRYINNKNNGVYKSGSDISVDMGELIMQCSFWQDLNLKADIPVFKQIYKVPTIVKAFVPDEFAGKDYFVMDFASFYEETDLASMDDLVEMVDMAEEINNHFEELIDIYIKNFKPGIKSITKKNIVNSAQVYELKFDDASFKKLIKYIINDYIENPETRELTREFVSSINQFLSVYNNDFNTFDEDFEEYLGELEANIDEVGDVVNNFMNKIDDIMIIGDKGIVIQYHITQSGYITKTAGNIDLVFDYGAIRKAFDIPEEPFSPFNNTRITLGIDFVSTNNSINRVYDVKMPTLTEYNSFSYEDINNNLSLYDDYSMYGVEETEEDDGSLKIYVNDFRNYTEIEPQFIDDILYLPAAEFIEGVFYGYIQEEQDSDDIYLYVRNSIIRFRADDTIVHTKDGTYELKYPPVYINDVLCVPVETFSEMLGYDIEWNPETLTLNITFNYNI